MHLRVDTIEQAIRASGMLRSDVGPSGYMVAYGIAEDNLRIGKFVVADSVNPLRVTRDAWLAVAKRAFSKVAEVVVICTDKSEHRRRVERREADIDGQTLPTWQDVVTRDYEEWDRRTIVIDTATTGVEENVAEIIAHLPFEEAPDL